MNVLITGSSGFLSKEFNLSLCKEYSLFRIERSNLLSIDSIVKNLIENKIEYIVHTSWAGVGSGTLEDFEFNLKVHTNLEAASELVKKIFIFGSGAEYSERQNYYSKAKKVISQRVKGLEKFANFRLFGCFGEQENDSRFIKRSMLNINQNKSIVINRDKQMDFFYVGDLISLVRHYISNDEYKLPNDMDCVYREKYTLSDIAKFLINKYSKNTRIEILSPGYDDPYTGRSNLLDSLNLDLKGMHLGIQEIYGY
jgi:nucleoside-diphosphate-sugar epimerase